MTQTTAPARLGDEVRRWRELRGLSQLALSARAEVSTRHLSFIENGRSRPTAEMILRLASALEVPMADQNDLLLAGGFAPQHPRRDLADENLSSVMAGLRGLLDAHAPYPALLLDDHWDVVDSNTSVDPLLAGCAPALLESPINVIRLSLHPDGLAPRIRNLAQWRAHLIHQLEQRIRITGGDSTLRALHDEVTGYPDATQPGVGQPDRGQSTAGSTAAGSTAAGSTAAVPVSPVVFLELDSDDGPLRLFSVASRIEGPADVTLDSLHLETFLPADAATREKLGSRV